MISRSTKIRCHNSRTTKDTTCLQYRNSRVDRIFSTSFASVYPLYVAKAERKGRTKAEVDTIIRWLTGYSEAELQRVLTSELNFEAFFTQAPKLNPSRSLITGVVCGIRVENVEDPLMKKIRQLDKLVDELAKGKAIEKVLRQ